MFYGIVKKISDRGFGFIGQEGGPDVYFHASILQPDEFARILPNQPVKFELAKRDSAEKAAAKPGERPRLRASVVMLIERMPGGTLPPPPQALVARHHPKARRRKATWKRRIDLRPNADQPKRQAD